MRRSKSRFQPRSPRYGLFLVWGCRRPMCTNSGAFGGLLGAVRGRIVELRGPRGPFGPGKSSCMCRVATIFLHLAVSSRLLGNFGQKKADSGPKLYILKWRFGTCDTRSWGRTAAISHPPPPRGGRGCPPPKKMPPHRAPPPPPSGSAPWTGMCLRVNRLHEGTAFTRRSISESRSSARSVQTHESGPYMWVPSTCNCTCSSTWGRTVLRWNGRASSSAAVFLKSPQRSLSFCILLAGTSPCPFNSISQPSAKTTSTLLPFP